MTWTSKTVVSKLYETVDATQRFDAQRFEQWLSVLRRRAGGEVFDALIGVFGSVDRPHSRYIDQEYAGALLLALRPPCPSDVVATIRQILPTWDYSVEQLPRYFEAAVGREVVLRALETLRSQCRSEEEQRAIETFRYWLRLTHPDDTADASQRPKGLTETAVLMALTNALGWLIVDWSNPHAATTFSIFTIFILVGYFVIWFYWKGRNWARILVLLTSVLSLFNLRYLFRSGIIERVMIGSEAVLAVFLLFWLNSPNVKSFFRDSKNMQTPTSRD